MYAVIKTGGKQYKVSPGQKLKIETLKAVNPGDQVDFEEVLLVSKDDKIQLGVPLIKGAKVSAKVLDHGRHKKIKIIKFKRRQHYDRQAGHRQNYTEVEIVGIN
jgi:large subunit ribosomal protein L21